jgi:hypothetical protein
MNNVASEYNAAFRIFYPKGSDIDEAVKHVKCIHNGAKFYRVDMTDLYQSALRQTHVRDSRIGRFLIRLGEPREVHHGGCDRIARRL